MSLPHGGVFQSTPSVGRATTLKSGCQALHFEISIHALRGEGDRQAIPGIGVLLNFNPRPPWGGRQKERLKAAELLGFQSTPSVGRATPKSPIWIGARLFQSTPSVGRATEHGGVMQHKEFISIHALRGEGDRTSVSFDGVAGLFQSTPSVGRATGRNGGAVPWPVISIHALRGEGDGNGPHRSPAI